MPRNRSEQVPEGFEDLNHNQREYTRLSALHNLGVKGSYSKVAVLWHQLSHPEQRRLAQGDLHKLLHFYKEQYRATQ